MRKVDDHPVWGRALGVYRWEPLWGCPLDCAWQMSGTTVTCHSINSAHLRGARHAPPDYGGAVFADQMELVGPGTTALPSLFEVCPGSDIFAPEIEGVDLMRVVRIMQTAKRHLFVVVTRYPERLLRLGYVLPPNVLIGVGSVPDYARLWGKYRVRVGDASAVRYYAAAARALRRCTRPLLRFMDLTPLARAWEPGAAELVGIDWAVVGGAVTRHEQHVVDCGVARATMDALQSIPVYARADAGLGPGASKMLPRLTYTGAGWRLKGFKSA